jgi:prepilin-type N-terminal cleavage/methylation domain-containing protein
VWDTSAVNQRGLSLLELLVVLALGIILLWMGTLVSVPWLARESMRGTLHEASVLLQTARLEAVSRNTACSFRIDLSTRTMAVVDMNDTSTTTDDEVLQTRRLPSPVAVAHPSAGSPVTFEFVSGSLYRVVFDPDGYVSSGAGELVLYGGTQYGKVLVYSAGGIRHQRWDGSSWTSSL